MIKKSRKAIFAVLLVLSLLFGQIPLYAAAQAQLPIYLNASQPVDARVNDLLARMTVDEKIGQMIQAERASVTAADVRDYYLGSVLSGGGSFPGGNKQNSTQEKWTALYDSYQDGALSTRLGIPIIYGVDAVHGHNNVKGATIFPHNIGLGATRNIELAEQIGAAVAKEVKATGVNWTFAPTIANPQDIRWGRTYEGFSENTALVSQLGAAMIRGLQGEGAAGWKQADKVAATAKHFIGEGHTDGGVNKGNVSLTEAEVLALDLSMYKEAIAAGVKTVMVSYNSIEGLRMHANGRLIQDVLKGELGFEGFVITDYNGIDDIQIDQAGNAVTSLKDRLRVAVNAGIDMFMQPTNWKQCLALLKELVQEGAITEERLNDAVSRILKVKFEMSIFEQPHSEASLAASFGSAEHRKLARTAVAESLVLLKNDKVNGLPILSQLADMDSVFVAGRGADNIGMQAGGWTITWQGELGNTTDGTTIIEGMREVIGNDKRVTYDQNGRGAEGHDVAIVVIGENPYAETDGDNLNGLKLTAQDKYTLENVKASGVPTIAIILSGRPLLIDEYLEDFAGVIAAWLPGTEGAGVADVLFTDHDFVGKLPISWPYYVEAYAQSNRNEYMLFQYGYGLTKGEATPAIASKPSLPTAPAPAIPNDAEVVQIPARIEAEDAYARSAEIDTEATSDVGGGLNIGWTTSGSWLDYYVEVPQAGDYDFNFRYAGNGGAIKVTVGNEDKGQVNAAGSGGWQNWNTIALKQLSLDAGQHKIRVTLPNGGLNLNWFEIVDAVIVEPEPPVELDPQSVVKEDWVEVWMTNEREPANTKWYWAPQYEAGDMKLEQLNNRDIALFSESSNITTITIDPAQKHQQMLGIGTSMEESTVYNSMKMSEAGRDQLLRELVDPVDGIGLSLIRVTIGTSDFTAGEFYSYNDMLPGETDEDLSEFSIQRDIDLGIIDNLKKLVDYNPNIQFFASPWSPPGWMKTSDSMIRGQVKEEYEPLVAKYYLKFIQAYEEQGIKISAMTLQNEPLLEIDYPSTYMSWEQQARIAKLLRHELDSHGYEDVLLWTFDHNPGDTMAYPAKIFQDNVLGASDALDGTAFHDYGGDLGLMMQMHELYPNKQVYLTERAVWGTQGADRMAQYFRNWARSYNSWVLMLDSNIATHHWVGTPDPTPIIQDASNPDEYWKAPEYYLLGQYAKFVRPGYYRIASDYGSSSTVTNVSFMSPDEKTIVSVIINQTKDEQPFKLVVDGMQIQDIIPAGTVATYQWERMTAQHRAPGHVPATAYYEASGQHQVNGDHIGNISGEVELSYMVEVEEAGEYYVDIQFASDDETNTVENSTITLLQDGEIIAAPAALGHKTWGWTNWNSKRIVAHLDEGIHTITVAIDGGEFNVHSLIFTKKQSFIKLPGKIEAEQFTAADEVLVQNNRTTIGFWDEGESLTYTVEVAEAAVYPLSIRYATGEEAAAFTVSMNGTDSAYLLAGTGDWDTWAIADDSIMLDAGQYDITLTAENGMNLDWLAIGTSIEASGELFEMELAGAKIDIQLINDVFAAELDSSAWNVEGILGISVADVVRVSDTAAQLTLAGIRSQDFDKDTALTVQVDPSQTASGEADPSLSDMLTANILVTALNDEEVIILPEFIPYDVDGEKVLVTIEGGTFNEFDLDNIALEGTAVTLGNVSLEEVEYVSTTRVQLTLGWDGTPYYGDLELTVVVPTAAYSDSSSGKLLKAKMLLRGTVKDETYHSIPHQLDAVQYYKLFGAAEGTEGTNNVIRNLQTGSWIDYRVDAPNAGQYTVELRFNYAAGGNIQLRNEHNETIGTFVVPSNGNSWSGMRTTVQLPAGEQTIRLYVAAGTLTLDWIAFQAPEVFAAADGIIIVDAVKYNQGTSHVIQYADNAQYNTGYTVAGTWFDFTMDVPEAGQYKVTTNYATQQGGVSVDFAIDQDIVGAAALPATGAWSTYSDAAGIVNLPAGVHTIRMLVRGDGANFRTITFEPYDGTIVSGQVDKPIFSKPSGSYKGSVAITMTTSTPGATIYYTTDGTYPTEQSKAYTKEIILTSDHFIRAIAVRAGMADSFIAQGSYMITKDSGSGDGGSGNTDELEEPKQPQQSTIQLVEQLTLEQAAIVIQLEKGKQQLHLPLNAPEWSQAKELIVKHGEWTLRFNQQAIAGWQALNSGASLLELDLTSQDAGSTRSFLQNAEARNAAKLKAYSAISLLQISLLDSDGKQQALLAEQPVELSVELGNQAVGQLVGIYRIDAEGSLTYVGGVSELGRITVEVSQWGNYVVLEYEKHFEDVPSKHWAHDVIQRLAAKQIINGISSTKYAPEQSVTRAEFVALIVRALQLQPTEQAQFTDVKAGAWYADAVAAAYRAGLISGKSEKQFAPQATITREEMAIIIVKAFEHKYGHQVKENAEAAFSDIEQVSSWARKAVEKTAQLGIMQGRGQQQFVPKGQVTRAESAQVISKLFN